jgi:hypothetical protein
MLGELGNMLQDSRHNLSEMLIDPSCVVCYVACFETTSGSVSSRSKQMLMSHARTFFYGFLQSQKNPNPGSIANLEI